MNTEGKPGVCKAQPSDASLTSVTQGTLSLPDVLQALLQLPSVPGVMAQLLHRRASPQPPWPPTASSPFPAPPAQWNRQGGFKYTHAQGSTPKGSDFSGLGRATATGS